ncbi:MAG: nrgA [Desulfomicrobiaceae bacterium]|jgi:Amt family ammonium transporter|nr:nrgA [Desulfomicrobiaceae bacterium]
MDAADTGFVLMSAALVMFMTPGLALFYGGMVRAKNVLATLMQSFILLGLVSVLWAVVGYTLAFGTDVGGVIGALNHLLLAGVGGDAPEGWTLTIPPAAFMIFQCMFAVITPALITGAFAERMRFAPFLVFSGLWLVLVYCPMAHWVWGGGWMGAMGALDFAGGAVVHMCSAAAALAGCLVIGPRRGFGKEAHIPHNLPMTILGAGILWFGWFGFNAGSALAANAQAAMAFATTHFAAAAGALSWVAVEWRHRGRATTLGAVSGAVAGLVAITPAAGYVSVGASLVMGIAAGAVCYWAVLQKNRFGYDDALDVVGIHGVGGTLGALATGVFADFGEFRGLLAGNPTQLWIQLVSVVATWVFCFLMSYVLFKIVDATLGLRVSPEDETRGLDVNEHRETGYQW